MFTRVVEITAKAGKSHELANTIQGKVLFSARLMLERGASWGYVSPRPVW